jgi:hypothetical protein
MQRRKRIGVWIFTSTRGKHGKGKEAQGDEKEDAAAQGERPVPQAQKRLNHSRQRKPRMPCMTRLFYDCIKRAGQFGGAHLVGDIPTTHIAVERPLGIKPSRRDGGDPLKDFIFGNGNLAEQVVAHKKG